MEPYLHHVQYYETDRMGITHHSNYIRWREEARVAFLEELGWGYEKLEDMGIVSPVTQAACEFKKPTTFSDVVEITVEVREYRGVRLLLSYRFLRNALQRCYYVFHHCIAVKAGKKLRPGHRFQVIIKVFRTFHKVRQITRRQCFKRFLHLFLRQIDKVSPDGVTNSA